MMIGPLRWTGCDSDVAARCLGGWHRCALAAQRDKKLAWELLKFLYFDRPALVSRYKVTKIIPPLRAAWTDSVFAEPDPYLGGQPLGKLFTRLAPDIPPVSQDQYSSEALTELRRPTDCVRAASSRAGGTRAGTGRSGPAPAPCRSP